MHFKMSEEHHILLQSIDRINTFEDPANCRISLNKNIRNFKCVGLQSALIPHTFYNITNNNNVFIIDGTPQTATPGNYSLTDIVNSLNGLMSLIGGNASYNETLNLITLNAPASFTVDFTQNKSMYRLFGFAKQLYTSILGDAGYNIVAPFGPKVFTSSIFINMNNIPAGVISSNENVTHSTFMVPCNVNHGDLIQFYAHSQFYINPKANTSDLNHFDIKFYDDAGFQLQGLSDYTLLLKVTM